ncbi:MAG TPA: FGGY family carbohydrate kinase [Solirubrobacteraceae bacterium]|nr:FGGY family carbohydrate kinase [Solirubrobacteraceae bacterium]
MTGGEPLLVGVDVGTTRVKAGLIGLDGRELGPAAVPTVWDRCPTGAEARPDEFVRAVRDVLAMTLAEAPPGEILGVGITSMAETAVLVDSGGRAVGPAVAWYDRRAAGDVADMEAALTREEIDRRTGLGIGPIPTVAMLRWVIRAHPEARRAVKVLSVAEWVVHSLGGAIAAEPSLASRTGALDINGRRWWREVIEWAGLPESLFPRLLAAGADWGRVLGASSALERLEGATLTVAGHDHLAAAIGSGVTGAPQVMDSCGTAEALVRAIPADAVRDPAQGLPEGIATGWHVLPEHYCLLAGLPLGIELTPLLDRLNASHRGGRASLDDEALVSLEGRLADDAAASDAREWLAALQATVTRADASLRGLEELGGPIAEVRISGGWAANPVLRRLKLAAFPNTVYPRVSEAGARGAALLAGQAAGAFGSVDEFPPPPLTDEPGPLSLSNQPNESLLS